MSELGSLYQPIPHHAFSSDTERRIYESLLKGIVLEQQFKLMLALAERGRLTPNEFTEAVDWNEQFQILRKDVRSLKYQLREQDEPLYSYVLQMMHILRKLGGQVDTFFNIVNPIPGWQPSPSEECDC